MTETMIKTKTKSDLVADYFIQAILDEKFKPGEKLPIESSLSEMLGVSRITIREGFKKLSLMGLVDIRQGMGTFVNTVTPDFFMRPLLPMIILKDKNIDELYDIRRAIECGAAHSAALKRTDDDIALLQHYQKQMKKHFEVKSESSQKAYTQADQEFHVGIIKASHNFYFEKVYDAIYSVLIAGIEKTSKMLIGRKSSLSEHAEIIQAITNKDAQKAENTMSIHLINAKQYYFSL